MSIRRFHFSFKVTDLESTRKFYIDLMGCEEGRSTDVWLDFDMFGNQMSAHMGETPKELDYCGKVDGISVPIPHFGCLIDRNEFDALQKKYEEANVTFILKPTLRYAGKKGEQMTMFVLDYSNNPLEFKSFTDDSEIFA